MPALVLSLFWPPDSVFFAYELKAHIGLSRLEACDGISGVRRRGCRDAITPRLGNKTVAESILYLH